MKKTNINLYISMLAFILLNLIMVISIVQKQQAKGEILRLHVVANSNTLEDQLTKLKVASKLQDYIHTQENDRSKQEIMQDIQLHANDILQLSKQTLEQEQKQYGSTLHIGKIEYDEKQSPLLDMEAGTYDSIQLILGEGQGENFWTLIFPEQQEMENLQQLDSIIPGLSKIYEEEGPAQTTSTTPEYGIKILEWMKKIV